MKLTAQDINIRYIVDGVEKRATGPENEDLSLELVQKEERTTITLHAKKPIKLVTSSFEVPYTYEEGDQLYINGYQSWTETREFELSEYLRDLKKVPAIIRNRYHLENYGDAWFMDYQKDNFHSFTFAYRRHRDGETHFIGSLNEENAFLIIHYKKEENILSIRSDCEYKEVEDAFCLYDFVEYTGEMMDTAEQYFSHYGVCKAQPIRGYTSWYLHYQKINEDKMHIALKGVDSNHFDLFQIDDGYETFVGDWMEIDKKKFPHGLKPLVDEIHGKGLKAGIWLAPFVCEKKSRLYKEHPDWLYHESGKPVFAGCNWSGDVTLDLRLPEVQDYIKQCLNFYIDMGFDFFKLDFLYAAALIHEDGGMTRAEIMRKSMKGLREILGDKLILGCGVPLSSAFNLVDYCRIGPDVSDSYDDSFIMRKLHRERVSTKVTMQNTIFRSIMDGTVFRCDPDVYVLRDTNTNIPGEARRALTIINHLCGSVYMTSDNDASNQYDTHPVMKEAHAVQNAKIVDIFKIGTDIKIDFEVDEKLHTITFPVDLGQIDEDITTYDE